MKLSLFCNTRYVGPAPSHTWPVPAAEYSDEVAARSMQITLDRAQLADQLGFDWVAVAEHHFAPFSITPNPMVMAGALTQVVKNAKIALLGPDIPILNPVRVAEEFAMLDTMTGGRIIAGFMRGTPNEYVTYNINPEESRGRFGEAVELVRKAWTETQPFGWQGRYYEYRTICIWPRPVQAPHPPMFMSGTSPESGKWAAENQISLGFAVTTLPHAIRSATYYREQCEIAGWTPTPDDFIFRLGVHVADTDEQAIDDLTSAGGKPPPPGGISLMNREVANAVGQSSYYGQDPESRQENRQTARNMDERIELGQLLVGGPETVKKQMKRIRDELGAGVLDLITVVPQDDKARKCLELLGTKILPEIRDW